MRERQAVGACGSKCRANTVCCSSSDNTVSSTSQAQIAMQLPSSRTRWAADDSAHPTLHTLNPAHLAAAVVREVAGAVDVVVVVGEVRVAGVGERQRAHRLGVLQQVALAVLDLPPMHARRCSTLSRRRSPRARSTGHRQGCRPTARSSWPSGAGHAAWPAEVEAGLALAGKPAALSLNPDHTLLDLCGMQLCAGRPNGQGAGAARGAGAPHPDARAAAGKVRVRAGEREVDVEGVAGGRGPQLRAHVQHQRLRARGARRASGCRLPFGARSSREQPRAACVHSWLGVQPQPDNKHFPDLKSPFFAQMLSRKAPGPHCACRIPHR